MSARGFVGKLIAVAVLAASAAWARAGDWGFSFSYSHGGRYYRCAPSVTYVEPAPVVCYDDWPSPVIYRDCSPDVAVFRDCMPDVVVYREPRRVRVSTYAYYAPPRRVVTYSACPTYSLGRYAAPRFYTSAYHRPAMRGAGGSFYYRGSGGRSYGGSFRYGR